MFSHIMSRSQCATRKMSRSATHWCVLSCRRRWDPFHCQMVRYKSPLYSTSSIWSPTCDQSHCDISFRADNAMYMGITLVILMDMYNHLAEKDKKYFRESREAMFKGQKLEDVSPVALCGSAACWIACFYCIVCNVLCKVQHKKTIPTFCMSTKAQDKH